MWDFRPGCLWWVDRQGIVDQLRATSNSCKRLSLNQPLPADVLLDQKDEKQVGGCTLVAYAGNLLAEFNRASRNRSDQRYAYWRTSRSPRGRQSSQSGGHGQCAASRRGRCFG